MPVEDDYNEHKKKIQSLLKTLFCHDYDVRRINGDICNMQNDLKVQVQSIVTDIEKIKEEIVLCNASNTDFSKQIEALNKMVDCTKVRVEEFKTLRENIYMNSSVCVKELRLENRNLKKSYEEALKCLKCRVTGATSGQERWSYKKRILKLQNSLLEEVESIKAAELRLQPFYDELQKRGIFMICEEDPLVDYDWLPPKADPTWIKKMVEDIQKIAGKKLAQIFADIHLHKPIDPMQHMVFYFHNEQKLKTLEDDFYPCD